MELLGCFILGAYGLALVREGQLPILIFIASAQKKLSQKQKSKQNIIAIAIISISLLCIATSPPIVSSNHVQNISNKGGLISHKTHHLLLFCCRHHTKIICPTSRHIISILLRSSLRKGQGNSQMVWCYQRFWIFGPRWWKCRCLCASYCYTCGGISFSWGEFTWSGCLYNCLMGVICLDVGLDNTREEKKRGQSYWLMHLWNYRLMLCSYIFWTLPIEDNSAAWMKLLNILHIYTLSFFVLMHICLHKQRGIWRILIALPSDVVFLFWTLWKWWNFLLLYHFSLEELSTNHMYILSIIYLSIL